MSIERMEGRIQRLLDARASTEAKLNTIRPRLSEIARRKALPENDPDFANELEALAEESGVMLKSERLTRRLAEYDESLASFQKHGQETPPTGHPVGVEINVPLGTFKITEHAPEG